MEIFDFTEISIICDFFNNLQNHIVRPLFAFQDGSNRAHIKSSSSTESSCQSTNNTLLFAKPNNHFLLVFHRSKQLNATGDDCTEMTEFRGFVDLPPGPERVFASGHPGAAKT